LTEEDGLATSW